VLLFADDFVYLVEDRAGLEGVGWFIFVLAVLGFPFRWDKFRGGTEIPWIGYWIELQTFKLGISEARAKWIVGWVRGVLRDGEVDLADLAAVLGRLVFAAGPLEMVRPFLAPLYAWSSAMGYRGKRIVPWSIRFILNFIAEEFGGPGRMVEVTTQSGDCGTAFMADAKAEGTLVRVGGWECLGGTPPSKARWFAVELTRKNAPWIYERGAPFKMIAALELYTTLLCVMVFGSQWRNGKAGELRISGATDNLGNTFCMARLMSPKFPLIVVLTELAAQLRKRELGLNLYWVPRDQNELADGLTNGDYSAFDPARRIEVDPSQLQYEVLPKMLEVSRQIYSEVQQQREKRKEQKDHDAPQKKRPAEKLRQTNPW